MMLFSRDVVDVAFIRSEIRVEFLTIVRRH
jgi:hypothetical protein